MPTTAPSPTAGTARGPLLTQAVLAPMQDAARNGASTWTASFDLGRSEECVRLATTGWCWRGADYPWPAALRERTIYAFDGEEFVAIQRYDRSLIKLVPTQWGAPTFEIDGIKMLPSAELSPYADAQRKAALVAPRGKVILDTCGGLGYFACAAIEAGATRIVSFEKNADVLWLRTLNPWSPDPCDAALADRLQLMHGDVTAHIGDLPAASFDAVLHDPPRFGIAGELYAQAFYDALARVLRPRGRLFHYTGAPNSRRGGRDLPGEVARRLTSAGFACERALDGVLATRRAPR